MLGGAGIVMFSMIISSGINILSRLNFTKRDMLIVALGVAAGMTVTIRPETLTYFPDSLRVILGSGITTGSLVALGLNLILKVDVTDEIESAEEKKVLFDESFKQTKKYG